MASASPLTDEETECPVCSHDFTEPKLLPCCHTICKKCVVSWLATGGQGGCPLCRAPILPSGPGEGEDVALAVEKLPTDLVALSLVDSKKALSGPLVCSYCEDKSRRVTSFCVQCR